MVARRDVGRGTNQEAIRRHNLGTVLRHVHRAGELSRSDLGRRTSPNRSTIADLTGALEESGLTERTSPPGQPGMGRPSAGVSVSRTGPFVIAVHMTSTAPTTKSTESGIIARRCPMRSTSLAVGTVWIAHTNVPIAATRPAIE